MIILIVGGSGSGKSEYAEKYLLRHSEGKSPKEKKRLYYLATMAAGDEESRQRIARHQQMREGKGFETIEVAIHIEDAMAQIREIEAAQTGSGGKIASPERGRLILLECLSNLAANEMFGIGDGRQVESDKEDMGKRILEGLLFLEKHTDLLVIVSNQIFDDGVPYDKETTEYIRLLAELNIAIAKKAETVIEVTGGLPNILKGEKEQPCM